MNHNLTRETLISLTNAAKEFKRHVNTFHRWHLKGISGVRLETIKLGGIRMTSREAIRRFIAATTAADRDGGQFDGGNASAQAATESLGLG